VAGETRGLSARTTRTPSGRHARPGIHIGKDSLGPIRNRLEEEFWDRSNETAKEKEGYNRNRLGHLKGTLSQDKAGSGGTPEGRPGRRATEKGAA